MPGIDDYRRSSNEVATNEQLVLRAFEKAITLLWESNAQLEEGDIVAAVPNLHIARSIFSELLSSLDFDSSEELATELRNLYVFVLREISAAGFEGSTERLQNAISVSEQLYEGFYNAFTPEENRGE